MLLFPAIRRGPLLLGFRAGYLGRQLFFSGDGRMKAKSYLSFAVDFRFFDNGCVGASEVRPVRGHECGNPPPPRSPCLTSSPFFPAAVEAGRRWCGCCTTSGRVDAAGAWSCDTSWMFLSRQGGSATTPLPRYRQRWWYRLFLVAGLLRKSYG